MLEQMYWVCSDMLNLGSQLAAAEGLPAPEVLERRIASMFDEMSHRARRVGIAESDVTDARYALAAFIDEQLMRSPWSGRQQWLARPLQFIYFQENTAGEGFYDKLSALQAAPQRAHVLQIYYLCLTLGFRGRYAVQGAHELDALIEQLRALLRRQLPSWEPISPNGTPRDAARQAARRRVPWIGLAIGIVLLAVVLYIILRVMIGLGTDSTVREIKPGSALVVERPARRV